jgi:hypoxanthine-DNA glycosylase
MESNSFAPIIDENCRILILGTMPGLKSLEEQHYYAHERNSFWPIIFNLFETEYSGDYQTRLNLLLSKGIALWDTLRFCSREGSLDSDIQDPIPNDIKSLLKNFNNIQTIAFNGQYAKKFFMNYHKNLDKIRFLSLPSTSPANARLTFNQKLESWSILKELLA